MSGLVPNWKIIQSRYDCSCLLVISLFLSNHISDWCEIHLVIYAEILCETYSLKVVTVIKNWTSKKTVYANSFIKFMWREFWCEIAMFIGHSVKYPNADGVTLFYTIYNWMWFIDWPNAVNTWYAIHKSELGTAHFYKKFEPNCHRQGAGYYIKFINNGDFQRRSPDYFRLRLCFDN